MLCGGLVTSYGDSDPRGTKQTVFTNTNLVILSARTIKRSLIFNWHIINLKYSESSIVFCYKGDTLILLITDKLKQLMIK